MSILHLINPKKPWVMPAPVWGDIADDIAVVEENGRPHRYKMGVRVFATRRDALNALLAINERIVSTVKVAYKIPRLHAAATKARDRILAEINTPRPPV